MSEPRTPYMLEPVTPPHIHQFGSLSGGKRVIRSWMVGELHDLVSSRTMPSGSKCWKRTRTATSWRN